MPSLHTMAAFDASILAATHDLTSLNIRSGTQVSARATAVISKLSTAPPSPAKPPVVMLQASSREANKLITVTEIAKRDLLSKGIKVFQYTSLSSQIVEIERKPVAKSPALGEEDGEVSDGAFQSMGAAGVKQAGVKKRAVPVLTVYLAVREIKQLRGEYGEQRT